LIATPAHGLALLGGAKSFEANWLLGSRRLNEMGLHAARVAAAHKRAAARRRRLAPLLSAHDVAAFECEGFVVRHDFLPRASFSALLDGVMVYRTNAREIIQGDTINRKYPIDPAAVAAIPPLQVLLETPAWRHLIHYVGARAADPAVFVQSLFRHAGTSERDPQTRLHADTFHPTVKAWLFLTDVAADEGPFSYVVGSHRLTPQRLAWEQKMSLDAAKAADPETREGSFRLQETELAALDLPPPRLFAVPANTLVVADTFGFHARGPSVRPSRRIEIFAYGPRSPFFASPFAALSTRQLGRQTALLWRIAGGGSFRRDVTAFDPPQG
jgi:hypothetical protein